VLWIHGELATLAECRNLDVDKVGAADPLTEAVMVMVIIIVEKKNQKFKTQGRISVGSTQMGCRQIKGEREIDEVHHRVNINE
jgi:hypothetical protein